MLIFTILDDANNNFKIVSASIMSHVMSFQDQQNPQPTHSNSYSHSKDQNSKVLSNDNHKDSYQSTNVLAKNEIKNNFSQKNRNNQFPDHQQNEPTFETKVLNSSQKHRQIMRLPQVNDSNQQFELLEEQKSQQVSTPVKNRKVRQRRHIKNLQKSENNIIQLQPQQNKQKIQENVFLKRKMSSDDYQYSVANSLHQQKPQKNISSIVADSINKRNNKEQPHLGIKKRKNQAKDIKPFKDLLPNDSYTNIISDFNASKKASASTQQAFRKSSNTESSSQNILNQASLQILAFPPDYTLNFKLIRNRTCLKRFYLDYSLLNASDQFLISAKKMPLNWNSTYHFSLENGKYDLSNQTCIAKLQGNFNGSIYNMFTNNPKGKQMVATIKYNSDCNCFNVKPRQVEVYIKDCRSQYSLLQKQRLDEGWNLAQLYELYDNPANGKVRKLVSKEAKWNQKTGIYHLNFHKQGIASVKNVILIQQSTKKEALVLLKQSDNQFSFDVSYPFSPLLAFGFAMTNFDFKLALQ